MKILFVISNSYIGGVERLALRLGKELQGKYDVDICIVDRPGTIHPEFRAVFNRLWDYGHITANPALGLEAFCNIIPIRDYDVIHIFNHFKLSEIIAKRCPEKLVQSIHFHPDVMPTQCKQYLINNQYKLKGLISDSKVHGYFLNYAYIPNFVDTKSYLPTYQGSKILWVGKFNTTKGINLLEDIIEISDREFIIVDGHPHLPDSESIRIRLEGKFGNRIDIRTSLTDEELKHAYSESEVILITSKYEGTPMALLEAMSSGLVPVSVPCGNIPNIIDHERTGFLFDTAMQAAVILDNIPSTMGIACRQESLKYDTTVMIPKYEAVYNA